MMPATNVDDDKDEGGGEEKRGGEVKSVTLGLYTQHMVVHVHAIKRTNTIMKVRGTTTREEGGGGLAYVRSIEGGERKKKEERVYLE